MKIFEAARAARPVDLRAKINLQAKNCCELEISSEYLQVTPFMIASWQIHSEIGVVKRIPLSPCLAKNQIRTVRV